MDPETARRLFQVGGFVIVLDFPAGSEFGIDLNSWTVGPRFRGVKMIPPGVHFVYYSTSSSSGNSSEMTPRTGFFHNFQKSEVIVKKFNKDTEELEDINDIERYRGNLKELDKHLGPYPYEQSWKKWISLTDKISAETVARLEPPSGRIHSVSQLVPGTHRTSRGQGGEDVCSRPPSEYLLPENLDKDLPMSGELPESQVTEGIKYVVIPKTKYPAGSTPAEITKHSMDSSYQLEQYLASFKRLYGDAVSSSMTDKNQVSEVLGELQFSFICFLVGQSYDSFEQWKRLLQMFLTCDEALTKYTDLFYTLIQDLHFQIREVPDDFFVDIVSSNNFLVSLLSNLFLNSRDNQNLNLQLKDRLEKFRLNLTAKFKWDFSFEDGEELDEEDRPVIVE